MELPSFYTFTRMRWGLREATSSLRLEPTFVILGAQKAGTSTLFRPLARHPSVQAAATKEVHYFDLHFCRGPRWYAAHFPLRTPGVAITGEASPYYLFHPHVPVRMRKHLPDARLIVLLRNPVDCAYSHYHHNRRKGRESLTFADAVAAESERTAGERERMLRDPSYNSFAHQHYTYVQRGHYSEQLDAFTDQFPREQLLVVRSECFFENPSKVWAATLDFLRLDLCPLPEHRAYNSGNYEELAGDMRERLQAHFAPRNSTLVSLWYSAPGFAGHRFGHNLKGSEIGRWNGGIEGGREVFRGRE